MYLGSEPVYISSPHHIVMGAKEVMRIPCNITYPPVFVSTDKVTLLQADPEVRRVKLQEEHLELAKLGEFALEEEEYSDSLLYTEEEIRKLENLINFGRVRERALHTVVDSFCHSGNCGSYQTDGQLSQGFSFNRVQDVLDSPVHWLVNTWEVHLEKVGSYCGLAGAIIFLAYYLWMSISWICSLTKKTRRKQRDNNTDLKISVRNYLPKPDEPAHLPGKEPAASHQEPAQYPHRYPVLPGDIEDEESPSLG